MENALFDVFGFGNDRPTTIAGSTGDELLPGTIDIIPGGQGAIALEMQGSDLLGGNMESLLLGDRAPLDVTVANNEEAPLVLDIDRNGRLEALTDGIMMIRHLFGFAADIVVRDAVAPDGTRTDAAEISSYLDELGLLLDVDGDGQLTALTDGIMIIRDLFGFAGDIVIRDAVAPGAPRDTVEEVTAYLEELKGMTLTPEPEPPETVPVVEVSPANGEEMVNLTRETVVRFGEKVDPATVNDESFFLIANGERVGGRIVVSSTEEFATFFYDEPLPASRSVRVVVAGDEIIARDGNAIDADSDGNPGGTLTADFRTLPLTRIEGTDVSGFVFDSFNTNADGSNIPVVGATIRVDAFPEANAITDENGFFLLSDVPAPVFSVHIDGSTADNAPEGTVYATVGKLFESVPGQETQLSMDGETFDIFLPPMATGDIQELSPTEDTNVGFGNAGVAQLEALFPEVDAGVWERTRVTFPAGSAQDEEGNVATQATIIPVDPERLPAPLPPGVDPQLVISIQAGGEAGFSQAGGATNFDVPAPVSFPNLEGLAPEEKSLIWSFNHDSGDWEVIGTGTVSADGLSVVSDPGVGILAPGWHFTQPGTEPEEPPEDPPCEGFGWGDAWALAKAAANCLKDLTKSLRALSDVFDIISSVRSLKGNINTLRKGYGDGTLTIEEVKAAAEGIQNSKEGLKTTYDALTGANLITKTFDIVKCANNIIQTANDIICNKEDCQGAIARFICNKIKPLLDLTDKLVDEADKLEKSIREAPMTALCLALDSFVTGLEVGNISSLSSNSLAFNTSQDIAADPKIIEAMDNVIQEAENFEEKIQPGVELAEAIKETETEVTDLQEGGFTPLLTQTRAYRDAYWRMNVGGFESRGRTSTSGKLNLPVLAPETTYILEIYDPQFNVIAVSEGVTAISGQQTILAPFKIQTLDDNTADADGDQLADLAEQVIGTSFTNPDTDSDGISDLAEVQQGLDPLGGQSFPTGIIASLPLQGDANSVIVKGSTLNAEEQTAYVATGSHGLAIVDASQFDNPIVLGQLDLPGDATDVAVDANLQIAAVASNSGGLHLVDVSDPMLPTTSNTVNISANQVEIADGIAYVTVGNALRAIDLLTGEQLNSITLPGSGTVTDLAREGTNLYAFTSGSDTFSVIDIADEQVLNVVGQVNVNIASSEVGVFAANGIAYLAGNGLQTIDVSNPSNLILLGDAEQFFTAREVALNGSGLALVAAEGQGLAIYDVTDPQDTDAFLTVIDTPGFASDVAIASGIAFVADDSGDLQVVNYRPFDSRGEAPTIMISSGIADVDPNTPGVQVTEGSSIPVFADVTDDVQVRNVELLVNDEVVSNAVSFPFDLAAIALSNDPNADVVEVQARATDTGGNTALSNILTFDLVPDTFGPEIERITPEDQGEAAQNLRRVEVRFNEALDEDSSTAENFQLRDAEGQLIAPENIQLRGGDRTVQLTYEPLPVGDYSLTIDASQVSDRAGNVLGEQDVISEFSLIEGTIFWVGGSGDWNDPNNWNTGEVPGPDDLVVISVPSDATITYSQGFTSVAGIFSQENLVISGGNLTVTGNSELNNGFTLSNGTLDADGNIIVGGDSGWTGGTISGDGELTNTGNLTLSGDSTKFLTGVLNNTGTINHNARGWVHLANGTVNNQEDGVYDLQAGLLVLNRISNNNSAINNSGTFRKSGDETTTVSVAFNLTGGTIDVQAGTLELTGGGNSTGGTYTASSGGVLAYSGGRHNFSGNYTGSGEGKVRISNSSTISNTSGETAVFNLTDELFEWRGGTISGDGGLTNAGNLTISGDSTKFLTGVLNNTGTINLNATGVLISNNISNNNSAINNSGTFRKSGDDTATVSVAFNLTGGTIDVQAGTLELTGGGNSTGGTYTASSGGVLAYSGGRHDFSGNYTGSGEGKVRISNSSTISNTSGETAVFNLTDELFEWTGGTISGDGGLTNAGNLTISGGDSSKFLNGVFNNTGTITHNATGYVGFNNGTLNNQIGGVYDLQGGALDTDSRFSNGGNINNGGIFRKSGEETAIVDVDFNLIGGTIDVQAGTLQLTRGGTSTGGSYSVAAGGVLDYSSDPGLAFFDRSIGTHNFTGTYTGEGEGKVRISDGATISNPEGETANFNLTGNLFEWIEGTIDSDGGLTNSGTLNISGEENKFAIGTFNNTGTIVHTSGVVDSISSSNSGNINNSGTYRKSGEEAATVDVNFNLIGGTIDVQAGTLQLTRGGTSTGGSYSIAAGGVLDYSSDPALAFFDRSIGTHNFTGTYTGEGEGKVRISDGATISNPEGETANFNLTGNLFEWIEGTIDSDGGLINSGTLNISGEENKFVIGTFNNTGTIVHTSGTLYRLGSFNDAILNNSGTYRKSGEDTSTIDIDFNNNGTVQVQQGTLRLSRSSGTSSGAHIIASNSVLEYDGSSNSRIHTLTGDYSVSGPGTVRLRSGTLDVSSDGGASFNPGSFDQTGGTFIES